MRSGLGGARALDGHDEHRAGRQVHQLDVLQDDVGPRRHHFARHLLRLLQQPHVRRDGRRGHLAVEAEVGAQRRRSRRRDVFGQRAAHEETNGLAEAASQRVLNLLDAPGRGHVRGAHLREHVYAVLARG